MKRNVRIHVLLLAIVWAAAGSPIAGQGTASDRGALRAGVERRFDVLPLRDGVALRPRDPSRGFRSIEVTDGPIAIDGQPVSGAELRSRLGGDADIVLELSYLTSEARRDLFEGAAPAAGTPDASPSPDARPTPTPAPEPDRPARRSRGGRDNDIVRFWAPIDVDEGEVIDGDVVGIGGPVRIDGDVRGSVVALGGRLTLGPSAHVRQNVVAVGGELRRDPGARIDGRLSDHPVDFGDWRRAPSNVVWSWWGDRFSSVFALMGTISRFAIVSLLAALVLLLGKDYADRAGALATVEPLKAGAIGLLAQALFAPVLIITIFVLVITIVGIPLLLLIPFAMLGLGLVGLVGFTGVAHRLGDAVSERFGWSRNNAYTTTLVGILTLMAPVLLARIIGLLGSMLFPFATGLVVIGLLLEYLAWTIGFGAVALLRFNRRSSWTAPLPSTGS